MKKYKHLTWIERLVIETLFKASYSISVIAQSVGKHRSTIYREIDRGLCEHLNTDLTKSMIYAPELAQRRYEENLRAKGPGLKIADEHKLANYLEKKICDEKYSPEAALSSVREKRFKVSISKPTLYSYIAKGVFLRLSDADLPVKGKAKKQKEKPRQKRASAGTSIEERDKSVLSREEFGHWEMDTVVGSRGRTKSVLLVLTERKTRQELIYKIKSKEAANVVDVLDQLELKWGNNFQKVFKTITVDNGNEFSKAFEMEGSVKNRKNKRVKIYYCHAYSSYERGSNENQNKLIRRWFPKSYDFEYEPLDKIKYIESWINNYPRALFEYRTSQQLFDAELSHILA